MNPVEPPSVAETQFEPRTLTLFRREIQESIKTKLHGDVSIAIPLSWQTLGLAFFVIVVTAGLSLTLAGYARIVTATGTLDPQSGIVQVQTVRNGVLAELRVREGQAITSP